MLVRIVKLTFQIENIASFEQIFQETKNEIRNFNGCKLLRLHQDKENPAIFFTYSYWDSAEALENYRNSAFFKGVWAETKVLFSHKPQAWSVDTVESLE